MRLRLGQLAFLQNMRSPSNDLISTHVIHAKHRQLIILTYNSLSIPPSSLLYNKSMSEGVAIAEEPEISAPHVFCHSMSFVTGVKVHIVRRILKT